MQMKRLLLILSFGFLNFAYGQNYPGLEKILSKELSEKSQKDGRWVFYADKANIKKVDKPSVKVSFPNYDLFQLTLTNYLGYHVNEGTCLVLFDSLNSKIILVEPLWYGGISESFVKVFIGQKFDSRDSLLAFLKGVNDLMEIGSGYKFRNTTNTDSLITYDLGYFKGDSYTTGGNGTSSTVRYNEDGVWRKIRIDLRNLTIIRYTSINPKTNDKEIIE
jgi:hypothetical protein